MNQQRTARDLVADLIGAIEDVDPRLPYVNAQIDRPTLAEAREYIAAQSAEPERVGDAPEQIDIHIIRRYLEDAPRKSITDKRARLLAIASLDRLAARPQPSTGDDPIPETLRYLNAKLDKAEATERALGELFVSFVSDIQLGKPQADNELRHIHWWEQITGLDFVRARAALRDSGGER